MHCECRLGGLRGTKGWFERRVCWIVESMIAWFGWLDSEEKYHEQSFVMMGMLMVTRKKRE